MKWPNPETLFRANAPNVVSSIDARTQQTNEQKIIMRQTLPRNNSVEQTGHDWKLKAGSLGRRWRR
jgi:hypothetical protein